jgi:hypothetical protein
MESSQTRSICPSNNTKHSMISSHHFIGLNLKTYTKRIEYEDTTSLIRHSKEIIFLNETQQRIFHDKYRFDFTFQEHTDQLEVGIA